uniref:Transglutaminase-like domain-containing protein n=1 Tax=Janibacter limosus TaxID=53458 RepID=A0AC61U8B4_9MICO|nr:transglutaminase-like domain-containing protein [Janibacter limosus]
MRGPDFTYNLELPERPEGRDPIVHFLQTKVGYCQQFAATMTLLARARGIPARVAVGFLPGSSTNGRDRIVRASDAHTRPELYFEGVGWTRFEPTPGQRAASVPGYSIDVDDATSTDTTSSTSEPTSSSSTSTSPTDETAVADPAATADTGTPRWVWWLLGLAGLLAVLAILPLTGWLARRRERRTARDSAERVEREWRELVTQLDDLGIRAPLGATPRQAGRWIGHRMHLEPPCRSSSTMSSRPRSGLATLHPAGRLPDVSHEVDALVGRVRSSRQRPAQLRSILWPRDGVDVWRSWGRAVPDRLPGRK